MRNASALDNLCTLDEPGQCGVTPFPRSSCSFDLFSLLERSMELEQDCSDGSTDMEGITSAMLSPVKRAIPVQNISFLYEIKDGMALNARGEKWCK